MPFEALNAARTYTDSDYTFTDGTNITYQYVDRAVNHTIVNAGDIPDLEPYTNMLIDNQTVGLHTRIISLEERVLELEEALNSKAEITWLLDNIEDLKYKLSELSRIVNWQELMLAD